MNDPRISELFVNESPAIRFIAAAIAMSLGPKKTQALMDEFSPRGIDWTQVVGGRPMHYWNGKTREQVANEAGDETADKVGEALQARGIDYPEAMEKANAKGNTVDDGETDDGEGDTLPGGDANKFPGPNIPAAGGPQGTPVLNPPAAATEPAGEEEPTFGGYPYSQLAGKSDSELLAMQNIGEKTIAAIRQYEQGRR